MTEIENGGGQAKMKSPPKDQINPSCKKVATMDSQD
jgi:hypothetical protein